MDDSRVKVLQDFVNKIEEHKNKSNQYVSPKFFLIFQKRRTINVKRQIESVEGSDEKVQERL